MELGVCLVAEAIVGIFVDMEMLGQFAVVEERAVCDEMTGQSEEAERVNSDNTLVAVLDTGPGMKLGFDLVKMRKLYDLCESHAAKPGCGSDAQGACHAGLDYAMAAADTVARRRGSAGGQVWKRQTDTSC